MTMKMSSHNLIYIVTDRCKTKCPVHMVMIGPEQFVHWLQTNIINEDDSIMGQVDALVVELQKQSDGRATYDSVVSIADQLDLQVTVIAGAQLTD